MVEMICLSCRLQASTSVTSTRSSFVPLGFKKRNSWILPVDKVSAVWQGHLIWPVILFLMGLHCPSCAQLRCPSIVAVVVQRGAGQLALGATSSWPSCWLWGSEGGTCARLAWCWGTFRIDFCIISDWNCAGRDIWDVSRQSFVHEFAICGMMTGLAGHWIEALQVPCHCNRARKKEKKRQTTLRRQTKRKKGRDREGRER